MYNSRVFILSVIFVLLLGVALTYLVQSSAFSPRSTQPTNLGNLINPLHLASVSLEQDIKVVLSAQEKVLLDMQRARQIQRVEAFLSSYGSPLAGYGNIIVDRARECGGSYRVLIGIAGSESGLGRVNVLKYNPYGFLNKVQYESQEQALYELSCLVSSRHLRFCGEDLECLARRYAGPADDKSHFIAKVRWFMNQV